MLVCSRQCNPSCDKHNSCCDDFAEFCVPPPPPPLPPHTPGACLTKGWPNRETRCGLCKALVDLKKSGVKSCTEFCAQQGRTCVAATEDTSDSCNEKPIPGLTCDTEITEQDNAIGYSSSDAICECGQNIALDTTDAKLEVVSKKLKMLKMSY